MGINAVVGIILILQHAGTVSTTSIREEQGQHEEKFVVKLHRQRVPVQGQSHAVSYKNVYFGTVYIGEPKQEFSVVFDTGSGHLVVPSTACMNATCRIHRRYDPKASVASVHIDADGSQVKPGEPRDQITVAFGTGEVTGQFVSDRLCLSDSSTVQPLHDDTSNFPISLRSTADLKDASAAEESKRTARFAPDCITLSVVTATEMTHEPFHDFSFDGILGLGLDALAIEPSFSFFRQMVAQHKVKDPMFGVFLADNEDDESSICFGGIESERLRSKIQWSPVALPELGHWQVQIHGIRIGSKKLDFCDDGQCRAVVDTGTSLLAVPHDFADELEDQLAAKLKDPPRTDGQDSELQVVDCKYAKGAMLHFDIEGLTISLSAADYARPAVMLDEDSATENGEITEDTTHDLESKMSEARCQPTILPIDMPAPMGPKVFIWGEPVLRKFYTTYDLEKKRIGFGLAAHNPQKVLRSQRKKPLLTV